MQDKARTRKAGLPVLRERWATYAGGCRLYCGGRLARRWLRYSQTAGKKNSDERTTADRP